MGRSEPRSYDLIVQGSLHHHGIWVDDVDAGERALRARMGAANSRLVKLTRGPRREGRARLDCGTVFSTRSGAIVSQLVTLRRARVCILDLEPLDVIDDVSDAWLDGQLDGWNSVANAGPYRRRLESLAGPSVTRRLLERVVDTSIDARRRRAACFAASLAACSSPTAVVLDQLVECALEESVASPRRGADQRAGTLLDGVRSALELSRHWDAAVDLAKAPIDILVRHRAWQVHGPAIEIVLLLPGPMSSAAIAALLDHAAVVMPKKGTDAGVHAARVAQALAAAPDTDGVRETLLAFRSHADAEARANAAFGLARMGGREVAIGLWQAMLAAPSPADRMRGADLLVAYGDDRDVMAAGDEMLRLFFGSRSSTEWHPPRGVELLAFVWERRTAPGADAVIATLHRKWDRLPPSTLRWITENLPQASAARAAGPEG